MLLVACLLQLLNTTTHNLSFKIMWMKMIKKRKRCLVVPRGQRGNIFASFLFAVKNFFKNAPQGNLRKEGFSLSHSLRGYSPTGWSQATVTLHAQLGGREGLMQVSASFPPIPPPFLFISGPHPRQRNSRQGIHLNLCKLSLSRTTRQAPGWCWVIPSYAYIIHTYHHVLL